ncbi:ribulose-phosphate 3-epimerase [Sporanaerobacter sp. PP17-6a]|uniref:ribulose-phosphate 3-epimerase n=1 Tax=Sporanaerobacter sp. PP17-6a TaxID=1891289 RepID=UPI0008A04987|nr:ribulose-phosphate 3-epimerase [Sporanaerobacter sp. PP17-6a]SCL93159.1 Ribulose-phosphate 3-epimerase [Sporanaerobacter sp. PP17-6a]
MNKFISPSIMCGDWANFDKNIKSFEENSIDYIHVDIMDGEFVPNFAFGTDFVSYLHKRTNIPLDVHLMVTNPNIKIDFFKFNPNDIVTFHIEASQNPLNTIKRIHSIPAKAGIALKPKTDVETLIPYIEQIELVLILTVHPGFAGQKLIPYTLNKIKQTRKLADYLNPNLLIEVDGNVSFENSGKMSQLGADVFVAGTSSLFNNEDFNTNVIKLRNSIIRN